MATQFNKFNDRKNFKSDFITGAQLVGNYEFPQLSKTTFIPQKLIPFNTASTEKQTNDKWIHFFIDDYQFERIWNFPTRYLNLFKRFEGVFAPDFSLYDWLPRGQRVWNCYRSRALAYWLQHSGIDVIPVVEWAEYSDFEWCLDGLPHGSTLAMEVYGCNDSAAQRYALLKGVELVCRRLDPFALVMYGDEIKSVNSLCKNVFWLDNYCKTIKKRV